MNILLHPTAFSMNHLLAYIIAAQLIDYQDRDDQNNYFGFLALQNSMSMPARNLLELCTPTYKVGGIPSMILYYRLIVQNSVLDTFKTILLAREKLMNSGALMKENKFNISAYIESVKNLLRIVELSQGCIDDTALFFHIMTSLESVPDEKFKRWMEPRRDQYINGIFRARNGQSLPLTLMEKARNEYLSRMEDKDWRAPDPKEAVISALEVKVVAMSTQLELMKTDSTKPREKKPRPQGPRKFEKWEITNVGPTTQHANAKGKDKTYNWCPKHGRYVIHDPVTCKLETVQTPIAAQAATIPRQDNESTSSDDE